jgi:hypothetical protein
VENITATQLQDLFAEAVAAQPEDKGVGRIHNSTAEELEDRLVLLLKEPAVNLTNITTEVLVQDVERRYHINCFLQATADWREIVPDEGGVSTITQFINQGAANVGGARLATILEEFYFLALPYRFRLKDQDSTPSIDALQQVMLGATIGQIKALHEIVTFADYRGIQETNVLLAVLNEQEASLGDPFTADVNTTWSAGQDERVPLSTMIVEWGRIQCFIVFLELCRLLIPELQELVVAPADECAVAGDRINEDNTRELPLNTIYRIQGWYYARSRECGESCGIVSKCYKTLLYEMYKISVLQK